jgi:hypothetical protein
MHFALIQKSFKHFLSIYQIEKGFGFETRQFMHPCDLSRPLILKRRKMFRINQNYNSKSRICNKTINLFLCLIFSCNADKV